MKKINAHLVIADFKDLKFKTRPFPSGDGLNVRMVIQGAGASLDRRQPGHMNLLKGDEVGFAHLDVEDNNGHKAPRSYLVISTIFIVKEARGGIGLAVYKKLIALAKKAGYKGIASSRDERNLVSDRVWNKLAKKRIGRWDIAT